MYEFKLPDTGEGLYESELLEWLVKVGDQIEEGDDVALISTEKVNVDLPSPITGTVAELPWSPGDVIQVGDVLMRIAVANEKTAKPEQITSRITADPSRPATSVVGDKASAIIAAPALRRYAKEQGIDLALVTASGPGGRLARADIDAYLRQQSAGTISNDADIEKFKLSGARLAASKRLTESSHTLATTTQTFEVFADAILVATRRLSEQRGTEGPPITPLSLIAKCLATTLSQHKKFNANIDEPDKALLMHHQVNIGVAVDTDAGLMVPVVNDVNAKDTTTLASELSELAQRARADALKLDDIRGATFTLSSTGGLERTTMLATTPIINLPNVATLWVSRITDRPRVVAGKLEAGPIMACTLSYDHRFINGAEGTAFINDLADAFQKV